MFIAPMLAQKATQPFDGEQYIAEPKMDGFRLILSTLDGVKAYTRHGNEVTARFPELWQPPIPPGTVLDGELIATDNHGRPDFEKVMKRLQTRNPIKVKRLSRSLPVQYVVFDILYHQGNALTHLPLMKRKELLEDVLPENGAFSIIRYIHSNGTGLFEGTKQMGLEGIVLKRKDSTYHVGKRSWDWQKVVHWRETEVVITGYRKDEPGWLIALEEDGQLRPCGMLELGIHPKARRAFYQVAQQIKTREDRQFIHVEPRIRCQVKYKKETHAGYLREPVFQGFKL
jgi:DNA ligase 1